MSKRPFAFLFLFAFLVGSVLRSQAAWKINQTAVNTLAHLSPTASCAIDQARLQWQGTPPTQTLPPYLQAVVASALDTELASPTLEDWKRDPRLYYWFMAQTAVKNGAYQESLAHLTAADAGFMLDAAGHLAATEACSVINWTIASEIGYLEPPDGYVQHLVNHQLYADVAETFTRLLHYDSERVAWRLSLAKAYVAMGETAVAAETLEPVLLHGTIQDIEAANKILQSNP